MEKKPKTVNKYKQSKCECSEDDNCGCPYYDTENKPKSPKSSAKDKNTSCSFSGKKSK